MPTRSIQITLSNATAGMILSDPVLDTKGNVLLNEGAVLTTALINSLARHQIDSLAIATEAASQADADAEQVRLIGRVEWLFRPSGELKSADDVQPVETSMAATAAPAAAPASATDILHRLILNFRSGVRS
jgi:hypothetical protein